MYESAWDQYAGETTSFDLGSETRRATRCETCLRWVNVTPPLGRVYALGTGACPGVVMSTPPVTWVRHVTLVCTPQLAFIEDFSETGLTAEIGTNVVARERNPEAFLQCYREFGTGYPILSLVLVIECYKRKECCV